MRKQIFTLALSTLFGLGVALAAPQAQDQPAPQNSQPSELHQPDPNRQIHSLSKRLNLTADQQNHVLPILTARQEQMKSIWADSSLSPKDRREKARAVREDSDSKIRAVLTDEQKQAYDRMQQQMRERMQQRRRDQQQNANPGSGSAG